MPSFRQTFFSSHRHSGIEFLRILAMLMIIAHHFATTPDWSGMQNPDFSFILYLLGSFGKIGVGIFFIISGYFMATSKDLSFKKTYPLIRRTYFYVWAIFLFTLIFLPNLVHFDWPLDSSIIKTFFPLSTGAYWFISSFLIVRMLYPFIRKWLDSMENRNIFKLFLILTGALVIPSLITIPLGSYREAIFTFSAALYYSFLGYLMARFHGVISLRLAGFLVLLGFLFICISPAIITVANEYGYALGPATIFPVNAMESAPSFIIMSVCLFRLFMPLNGSNVIINFLGSLVFGIYLIHENVFSRIFLWEGSFRPVEALKQVDSPTEFVLRAFGIICFIFIGCACIEALRQFIVWFLLRIFRRKPKSSPDHELPTSNLISTSETTHYIS